MKTLFFVFVFFILSTFLSATIINIPADQPTIQAGINVAVDGDTVLVQQGTYVENINYSGKNIAIGSLFLTTQDTTYISQTIIDGNQNGCVVTFESGEDSTAVLSGFTILNGDGVPYGGGINCVDSSPSLEYLTLTDNSGGMGGGIFCWYSSPSLKNVTITDNSAIGPSGNYGGGICCWYNHDYSPSLVDVTIISNSAWGNGAGIHCYSSSPSLENVTISGNNANSGVYYGGGGIYCDDSNLSFSAVIRCNIFLNFAARNGNDLFSNETLNVIVDTFTVLIPTNYFASPIDNFTFDILHSKIEQVNHDLYVSPGGSDDNSGLTPEYPLLTISYALAKIIADSTNPHTIHLSNGIYSPSQTGEIFPLNCINYVSLKGDNEEFTILDGNDLSGILYCYNDNHLSIEDMTIQNGYAGSGGGIHCSYSSPSLGNLTITNNSAYYEDSGGGGIFCWYSSPSLKNVTITDNSAIGPSGNYGGGICCWYNHDYSPSLVDVTIISNSAWGNGAGIHCYSSSPSLENVTISGNNANSGVYYGGGGIYCSSNSSPTLLNCILWYDSPQEIYLYESAIPCEITISYSNIHGGETSIVTNNGIVNWLEGNIYEVPLFVGTGDHPYSLLEDSPCIDAGNPDPIFYDPEDPNNPGYALYPAMGTIINDMGAYGGPNAIGWITVPVNDDVIIQPTLCKLYQNYPNPFNPTTTISFSVTQNAVSGSDGSSFVTLDIYNLKGQKVKTLVNEVLPAGEHSVVWDGKNANNKAVASGIYFYNLKVGNKSLAIKKCLLLK